MEKYCECGCGKIVLNRFVPGHNARVRTIETLTKMSINSKGKIPPYAGKHLPEVVRLKISNSLKGHKGAIYRHTEEAKKKISSSHKGKIISDVTKRKLSLINIGKHLSEETKRKMSIGRKGKCLGKFSDEHRKNLSISRREGFKTGKIKLSRIYSNTSIEIAIKEQLEKNNIEYEQQKYIRGVGFVDFFLPNYDIIIECDGDFWHGSLEAKQKDSNRDFDAFFFHKYKTIRFWQHKIKESPEECMQIMRKEMETI